MTIEPPATIGMLGGGQLGRYALIAARLMGYRTIVLDPDAAAPAGRVADEHIVASYDDPAALDHLAATCAVVTIEFENPPAASLARLASDVLVAPAPAAVAVTQDRLAEKRFLLDAGTPTAPYAPVMSIDDRPDVRYPAILKTARLGYDGKGQRGLDGPDELAAAWAALGAVPCVLERRLPLDGELSVLVARTAAGDHAVYPVTENVHVGGILDLSVVPARVDAAVASRAAAIAVDLACQLDYVGVLAVEVFVSDGHVLVNELAPRPHNSGHWTLDAAPVSQFDQQVRAICGSALGPTGPTVPAAAMVNLLGDVWAGGEPNWAVALADPAARLHLYGKAEPRPGRKMGHLTVVGATADDAAEQALDLRDQLRSGAAGRSLGV